MELQTQTNENVSLTKPAKPKNTALRIIGVFVALAIIGLTALGVARFALVNEDQVIDQDLNLAGSYDITVDSANLLVTQAAPGSKPHLKAKASWLFNKPELQVTQTDSKLDLRYKNDSRWQLGGSVKWELTVPADIAVKIKVGSGNLDTYGLNNDLEAQSGSGNIKIENLKNKTTKAKASSGNINIEGLHTEKLQLETESGNIDVVRAETTETNMNLKSGNIKAEFQQVDKVTCKSQSGNIELDVPNGTGYQVYAKTESGKTASAIKTDTTATKIIDLTAGSGNIEIR